ncbi:Hypothetical predicted protein [Paramuricea clavata]|uniref:Uncharacterized protein n=1 Tax=Paramuricea clavata TaxID=317549 RepID=A0A7D9DKD0_PARCT|nr:Hypothetical predicted protein [Paramuricea clavata]
MAEKDLQKWTTFFHEAGVPRGPATEYATLFCNHRIKDILLGDLTKEILNDIGIIVMGDVMSILKHAKAVYAKLEREKMSNQLVQESESVDEPLVQDDPPQLLLSSGQVKKKKLVAKLPNKPKTEVQQTAVLTLPAKKKMLPTVGPKITVTVDDSSRISPKKRPAKTTMSLSDRFASKTVLQPKVSPVSVEGSKAQTNTVKKVLTKTKPSTEKMTSTNKGVAVKRKSAFERLGKEESSNVSKDMERLSPKIKITKLTKSPVAAPSSKVISLTKSESSVFKRLGETDAASPPSTTRTGALTIRTIRGVGSRIVSDDSPEKPAKSHSVLRPLKPIRAVQPVKPVSTVKARVSADTKKESSRKSVFSRLGSQT